VAIDGEPDSTLSPASHPSKSINKQMSASRLVKWTPTQFHYDLLFQSKLVTCILFFKALMMVW